MKKAILLLSFVLLSTNILNAQTCEKPSIKYDVLTYLIRTGSYNFQMIGNESGELAYALFTQFPKTKKKGYVWKFKNIHVPGIKESLTFEVHQGLHEEKTDGYYFTTFTSEKDKISRLNQNNPSEKPAVIIYIKRGRKYGLQTQAEAACVQEFLNSLLGNT